MSTQAGSSEPGSGASTSTRGNPVDGGLRKVTAIVRVDRLERVERRLQDLLVPGISSVRPRGGADVSPEEILKRRYAKGEIDRDTYQRMLADVERRG